MNRIVVKTETVLTAKEFFDKEITKYKTFNELVVMKISIRFLGMKEISHNAKEMVLDVKPLSV